MSIEIQGKVSSCAGYAGQSQGVGQDDDGLLMDLSSTPCLSIQQSLTKVVRIPPVHPV